MLVFPDNRQKVYRLRYLIWNCFIAAIIGIVLAACITRIAFHQYYWTEIFLGLLLTITNGIVTAWIHFKSIHYFSKKSIFYGLGLNGCKFIILFCILLLIFLINAIEIAPFITVVFVGYFTFMIVEIYSLHRLTVENTLRK